MCVILQTKPSQFNDICKDLRKRSKDINKVKSGHRFQKPGHSHVSSVKLIATLIDNVITSVLNHLGTKSYRHYLYLIGLNCLFKTLLFNYPKSLPTLNPQDPSPFPTEGPGHQEHGFHSHDPLLVKK